MSFIVSTAPALEPITTTEAKAHLRISNAVDDTYITTLISVARQYAEDYTRRAFISQTITAKYDAFPTEFSLERSPVQAVNSITYTSSNGATQTLLASKYTADYTSVPARVVPAYSQTWPSVQHVINAVTVEYVAGYGSAASDVPLPIVQAMLLIIGHYYENREPVIVGTSIAQLPMAVESLLRPYRVY